MVGLGRGRGGFFYCVVVSGWYGVFMGLVCLCRCYLVVLRRLSSGLILGFRV